jgi:hypothetical protein
MFDGAGFQIPTCGKKNEAYTTYDWHVTVTFNYMGSMWTDTYDFAGTSSSDGGEWVNGAVEQSETCYVEITPNNGYNVGWGAAFGFQSNATGVNTADNKSRLLSVSSDPSWAHMHTENIIGNRFRESEFNGCTRLKSAVLERWSSDVTTIGNYYCIGQYSGCTSLIQAADENLPDSVTSIGNNFRREQYSNCTSLIQAAVENIQDSVTSIGTYFRYGQYRGCTILTFAAAEAVPVTPGDGIRYSQYEGCTNLRVGTYIHDTRFAAKLNRNMSDYGRMFALDSANTAPDLVPRYYLEDGTTSLVTNLTPTTDKYYVTNRTGIAGYANLNENWK